MKLLLSALILVAFQDDSAVVRGVVKDREAGEGIVGAIVELSSAAGAPLVTTTTEGGRFTFSAVKPGTYRVVATHPSGTFNSAEHMPQILRAGQTLEGVTLEMARTGSIAGRILDASGQPVGYARVLALQPRWVNGQRVLRILQSVQSDDNGDYRLFWLPPGEYYVAARPQSFQRRTVPVTIMPPGYEAPSEEAISPVVIRRLVDGGSVVEETFPLTYFGGTTDPQRARLLTVASGTAVADVALANPVLTHRIRGRVTPPAAASIRAIPVDPSPQSVIATATADGQGNFEIAGVVPGRYWLFVTAGTIFNPLTPEGLTGSARVDVGSGNVDGAVVSIRKGFDLTGRIEVEGRAAAADLTRIRIGLRRNPDILGMPAPLPLPFTSDAATAGTPSSDGIFTLRAVSPGQYDLLITALPEGSYVKSTRIGIRDFTGAPLLIDTEQGPISITLGTDAALLDGTVLNTRRNPAVNATVALIPDIPLRARIDLYRTFTTDGEGRFTASAIPPGRYTLLAWDTVEDGRWADPEFIERQESRGTTIALDANSKRSVMLQAIERVP